MLTVQELLKPRYKVIADYPDSPYSIGEILKFQKWGGDFKKWANYDEEGIFIEFTDYFDDYPHLFEPLPWWKDRNMEDMPEYLRIIDKPALTGERCNIDDIVKVYKHFTNSWGEANEYGCQVFGRDFLSYRKTEPATREEYEAYIQTINQLNNV